MTIIRAYKLRIYPTREVEYRLHRTMTAARLMYNWCLEYIQHNWNTHRRSVSKFDLMKSTAAARRGMEDVLGIKIHSSVYENVAERAHKSYSNFYAGRANPPRFASRDLYNSIQFRKPAVDMDMAQHTLRIPFVGDAVRWRDNGFRKKFLSGTVKRLIISREAAGETLRWYAVLQVEERNFVSRLPRPTVTAPVGIDAGVTRFAVLSDGTEIAAPQFLEQHSRRIAKLQRKLSRQLRLNNPECFDANGKPIKGKRMKLSKRALQTKKRIKTLHEHIAKCREHWLHSTSNALIRRYEHLVVENLSIQAMLQSEGETTKRTKRGMSDASWAAFQNMLLYKAAWHGRKVDKVAPNNTTRTCGHCGFVMPVRLIAMRWKCPQCGTKHDRKQNAAHNIVCHEERSGVHVKNH